jgi:HTH-type transcriptional regulator/antitoxin HigA
MTTATEIEYGQLLQMILPRVITNRKDHARFLAEVERLMLKGEGSLTPAESTLLDLLFDLVHDYEQKTLPRPKPSTPAEMLEFLMDQNSLKAADLPLPRSRVSEILSGKRAITKSQAIALGERFRVSPSLFLGL